MIERPATSKRDAQWPPIQVQSALQVQRRSVRGSKGLYCKAEVLECPPMDRAMSESDGVNPRSSFSSSPVTWRDLQSFENSAMRRLTMSRR